MKEGERESNNERMKERERVRMKEWERESKNERMREREERERERE